MPNLADIFNNLKTGVIRTKTSEIDQSIDRSIGQISKFSSSVNRNAYIDTLRNIVSKVNLDDPASFLKDIKDSQVEFFDRSGRIQRYHEYDLICRNIAHCSRALNVLTDCIIAPDDITKNSLMVSMEDTYEQLYNKELVEKLKKDMENIKRGIDIEKYSDKIVRTTLKKGDYFIEVIHSPKGEQAFSILNEGTMVESGNFTTEKIEELTKADEIQFSIQTQKENNNGKKINSDKIEGKLVLGESSPPESIRGFSGPSFGGALQGIGTRQTSYTRRQKGLDPSGGEGIGKDKSDTVIGDYSDEDKENNEKYFENDPPEDKKEKKGDDLKDIFITLHNPRYVIRLETERFRSCLGYLVFPKIDRSKAIGKGFSLVNTDVDGLCSNIIQQLKDRINANDNLLINNSELKNVVIQYLSDIEDQKDLEVRYVPPDKMTHMRINVDLYDPYGESIFDSVLFDCKLFMALKTANTIKRLSNSTDKRLIKVETGLPHNAKNLVETLKENMKKRKISIDSFGSIDTIPSIISTFEDIYIPTRDGKEYVSIDTMRWGGDPQEDIEPLKFVRDNIVANLQVPPAFIGLEENATNRNLLTAEAVQFARTIISFQKQLSVGFHDLFSKIYLMLHPDFEGDILDHIKIGFSPPKAAMYEHVMEYLENAARAISTLKDLGIPDEFLKKQYLSFLDWEAIEKYEIDSKLKAGLQGGEGEEAGGGSYGSQMGGGVY